MEDGKREKQTYTSFGCTGIGRVLPRLVTGAPDHSKDRDAGSSNDSCRSLNDLGRRLLLASLRRSGQGSEVVTGRKAYAAGNRRQPISSASSYGWRMGTR